MIMIASFNGICMIGPLDVLEDYLVMFDSLAGELNTSDQDQPTTS